MSQLFSRWLATRLTAATTDQWTIGAPFRCALIDDSITYSPDPTTQTHVSDVFDGSTASEFTDASYSRQDIENPGNTGTSQNPIEFFADDVVFPNLSGGTVQGVLIYHQEGGDDTTPADDRLVAYLDGPDYPVSTNGEDFVVDFNDDGSINDGPVFEINL